MSKDDNFKSPNYDKAVNKALNELVTFTQNGKKRTVTKLEASIESRTAAGLAGNSHALRQTMADARRIEEQLANDKARRAENCRRWKAHALKRFALHFEQNHEVLMEFPHPEDVYVDEDDTTHYLGPMDLAEHERMLHTKLAIEALLLQSALERRLDKVEFEQIQNKSDPVHLAMRLSLAIPPRHRYSTDALHDRLMELEYSTKLELLRDTYQAWRKIGHDKPRGWRWPTNAVDVRVKLIDDLVDWMSINRSDDGTVNQEEMCEMALSLANDP